MQQNAKPKLPNGKLRELSEKYGVHYMKAARLTSGAVSPTTSQDYQFLTDVNNVRLEIIQAKEKFLQSQSQQVA